MPDNFRLYGKKPYTTAVLHGGPGAPGEMAPVARELAKITGVIEPLQTKASVTGQIEELKSVLAANADGPVTVIGWSWGAWLGWMFAARHPESVKKLILASSGPFEDKYATGIMSTRLERLSETDRKQALTLIGSLEDPNRKSRRDVLAKFGSLMARADAYDPLMEDANEMEPDFEVYRQVGAEACELRKTGRLLEYGKFIRCPVLALHGDYDPHPAAGVREPLAGILPDFQFIMLQNCGHKPWLEKQAKDRFYEILREEIE